MTDQRNGLSRALSAPVRRAMSRLLNPPTTAPIPASTVRDDSAVVDCAMYVDGVRQPGTWHYAEALAAARRHGGNAFVWIGLHEPGPDEFADIATTFKLHELAVEDAVKSYQRAKIERYEEMTFLVLRTARYVEHAELTETSEVVETGEVMLFVGPDYVITVRHGDACRLAPVRADLEAKRELLAHGPWAVAHAVYDRVVDLYLDVAAAIEVDLDTVEEHVFARTTKTGDIQRIYQLKRELVEFRRAVLPLGRPLSLLVGGQVPGVPKEIRRYFRDVADHLSRVVEQVTSFDDLINSVLQARLAQISVDQNNDMRKIAAWAGIAAVWTSIAGIEGMNFDFMPELRWRYGYPVVLTVMVAITLALYRAFRRSGWL